MRIAQAAHKSMLLKNEKENVVLAGLRRNGMLSGRPDLRTGKMEKPGGALAKLEVGSHRMRESWLEGRMSWIDETGRPIAPDWSRSEVAKKMEDLQEADYCSKELTALQDHEITVGGKKIEVPVVDIDCDEQSLFGDADALKLLHPKLRRLLANATRTDPGRHARLRAAQKKVEEARVAEILRALHHGWKLWLSSALVKSHRKDLLDQLQPGVSFKGKKGKKELKKKASPDRERRRAGGRRVGAGRSRVACVTQRWRWGFINAMGCFGPIIARTCLVKGSPLRVCFLLRFKRKFHKQQAVPEIFFSLFNHRLSSGGVGRWGAYCCDGLFRAYYCETMPCKGVPFASLFFC